MKESTKSMIANAIGVSVALAIIAIAIRLGMDLAGLAEKVSVAQAAPLPVTATVLQPVEQGIAVNIPADSSGIPAQQMFVVPAGKRLIVEHFSTEAFVDSGISVKHFVLGVSAAPRQNIAFFHFIPPMYNAQCGPSCGAPAQVIFVASQPVRIYVEAGQALVFFADFNMAVGANALMKANFSGYLVDAS